MTQWRKLWWAAWRQESFACGVRALVALASVMAGGWWLGQTQALIPLLLGVLAGAIAESDDSWRGLLRAQATTLLSFTAMALAVQASLPYPGVLLAVLGLAAFGLTLLGAVGERYRTLAVATLILAVYTALASHAQVAQPSGRQATLWPVIWLLCGAAWYGVIAVLWALALPMLPVRQKLAVLYEVLGGYLQLKSRLLAPVRDVDLERRRLALALGNGRVVEALNAVKESLFLRTGAGRTPRWLPEALHLYFVAQDVHERVTSSHEHYDVLAEAFFHSDVLYRAQRVVALLGQDCQALAQAIQQQTDWARDDATGRAIDDLEEAIRHLQALPRSTAEAAQVQQPLRALSALADNLAGMVRELDGARVPQPDRLPADSSLLNRHPRSLRDAWQRVRAQAQLSSPVMRHAIRLALALLAGGAVMQWTGDHYGYWILLTIVFVCQPQYGATLVRLAQRIWGTVLGLVVGWALLRLFPDVLVQSAFTVAAGALFFVSRHSRYTLATAAITSLVLLSFNQVGDGFDLIKPRLIDTLIGSLISGLAVWLVLPSWQSRQLHRLAGQTLHTQAVYLQEIMRQYRSGKQDHLVYRLARRNAHNAEAAFSNAMAAVFQEPVHVRRHMAAGTQFLVLSHTLLNYLSALGAHRGMGLAQTDNSASARAADSLQGALMALAEALEDGRTRDLPDAPGAADLLADLAHAAEATTTDSQRVLHAQLGLALRLLPQLRQHAAALLPSAPSGRDAGEAPVDLSEVTRRNA